jgi:hypothetical protein
MQSSRQIRLRTPAADAIEKREKARVVADVVVDGIEGERDQFADMPSP